ncbi:MAG: type II secretion system F family protein [Candidatus Micrarchaeota archaeon]|nr:type II secretion system F family protein [Candidatus Micrarchaeota archaeon]
MAIGFMFLNKKTIEQLALRFKAIGQKTVQIIPGLKYDLRNAHIEMDAETYAVGAFFSALIIGVFAFGFLLIISQIRGFEFPKNIALGLVGLIACTLAFFALNLYYPKITSRTVAAKIDRGLIFASRDMLIQISSGIPLYQAIENIAEGDYGQVSVEFKEVAAKTRTGKSLLEALEEMAIKNQSKYLKKMCWQLVTAIRSGTNLTTTLKGIIKMLVDDQLKQIKAYNAELNFIVLIYLLAAAVLPTVGSTVLVIFSVFGVLGITPEVYLTLIVISLIVQAIIIGYVYVRRPKMYG